jgi:hypothetical protein
MSIVDVFTSTQARPQIALAEAKLPNDLSLNEFVSLSSALSDLVGEAHQVIADRGTGFAAPVDYPAEPDELIRVQYGSDFLIVVGIAAGVAGVLLSAAKALDYLAAAGLKNEERLARRQERLQQLDSDLKLPLYLEREVEERLKRVDSGGLNSPKARRALGRLARYGIRISIEARNR